MRFFKYQGLGNDFILLEDFDDQAPKDPSFAVRWCDRRFGIGADGILYLMRSPRGDAFMKILNSDGSEAEMCGNGIRCVAKHLFDQGLVPKVKMKIDTLAGIKEVECRTVDGKVREVTVGMGAPELDCAKIPMMCEGRFVERELEVEKWRIKGTAVSMGNPHFVTFQRFSEEEMNSLGPKIERHPLFPKRTNVEFAQLSEGAINLRVYERGAGWTLACGTGACATVAVAALRGDVPFEKDVEVRLPGGSLWIKVGEDLSSVTMRGPAELVYTGEFEV
ncbi:MAG: diaminopimelate epimerase [Methanomassiliicoccales archaeon]